MQKVHKINQNDWKRKKDISTGAAAPMIRTGAAAPKLIIRT